MNQLRKPLNITIGIIALLGLVIFNSSGFYIDWLWFKSVGFTSVWSTVLTTKITLFVIVGLLTSLFISTNIFIAYRTRPMYVPMTIEADNLERYRAQIEPIRRWVFLGIVAALVYFGGSSGSVFWSTWLQFRNATPFGVTDPQFGLDISFFAFKLPMYQALISWGISLILISVVAAVGVHYLYGGIRPQAQTERTTTAARVQISVLLGFLVLLKAVAYWYDRYALALKENRLITGMTFTDVNALLPAKAILARLHLSARFSSLPTLFVAHGYFQLQAQHSLSSHQYLLQDCIQLRFNSSQSSHLNLQKRRHLFSAILTLPALPTASMASSCRITMQR